MNLADVLIFLSFWKVPIIKWECLEEKWDAQYINWVITICSDNINIPLLTHETGHAYKDKVMNEKQTDLWNKISWSCSKRDCFVSDYAMTNPEEDFAETFRWVSLGWWASNKVVKTKMKFIKKLLLK